VGVAAALVLATAGVVLALRGPSAERLDGTGSLPPAVPSAQPAGSGAGPSTGVTPEPMGTGTADPSSAPTTPDPSTALADGTYPAYVRGVDVPGATVTIDVIQTFEGRAAVRAAIEDGMSRHDARQYRYWPVYVRNENPLLRTFPVAPELEIRFVGVCEEPGSRTAALRALREATAGPDDTFYYAVTLEHGAVTRVVQRLAVPAC
jgi:hypothetical protein